MFLYITQILPDIFPLYFLLALLFRCGLVPDDFIYNLQGPFY